MNFPHRTLGANWEGVIISNELYQSEGKNTKFVPVLVKTADSAHIPSILSSATCYDSSDDNRYEDLLRHLSNQPRVLKPPLGTLREMPPESEGGREGGNQSTRFPGETEKLVMFSSAQGVSQVAPYDSITSGDELTVVARSLNTKASSFFVGLRDISTQPVGVVFGETALLATLKSAEQHRDQSGESWTLILVPEDTDYGAGFMEISTEDFSADKLADMRARRILLNEDLSQYTTESPDDLNNAVLEVFVRGQSTPIKVEHSPLPELYEKIGEDPRFFLAVARLVSVLWLRLGGVIETVDRLEFSLTGDRLSVDFEGVRARKYVNVEPAKIEVAGVCNLG